MNTAPRKRGRPRLVQMETHKNNTINTEDVYDFDVEKEDGLGIIKSGIILEFNLLEHACNICPRTFKTLPGLKRHKTSHVRKLQESTVLNGVTTKEVNRCNCCGEDLATAHAIGDFECYDCGKFFKLKVNMERHQLMVHCYDDILNCPTCDFCCTDKESLSQHLYSHAGTLKPYSCPICFTSFSRNYHLIRHNKQTGCDGSERAKFSCQVCGKVFNRKDNLVEHLRGHAGITKKNRTYNCEYCNEKFVNFALLIAHRRNHLDNKSYRCDLCPKLFPSSGAMKKHRRVHTGERPYECQQCFAKFAAKETLNRHIKTHNTLKPHACEFCGKTFIQISQLRNHLFYHTRENGFTCDICGKSFSRRSRLTLHIKYVHEGAEPYKCTVCNKALLRKEDIQRHHIIHSGVKAHACPICGKRFAVKSSLKMHLLTHSKEPPLACGECGRTCIRLDCLLRHMRSKHRDVLAEIMADAEKKKLEAQLLGTAKKKNKDDQIDSDEIDNDRKDDDENIDELKDNEPTISEESNQNNTLAELLVELLNVLVDESKLKELGWPGTTIDNLIESLIKRSDHTPVAAEDDSYETRLSDNSEQLFLIIINDTPIQPLLSNHTIEEVIEYALKLLKAY